MNKNTRGRKQKLRELWAAQSEGRSGQCFPAANRMGAVVVIGVFNYLDITSAYMGVQTMAQGPDAAIGEPQFGPRQNPSIRPSSKTCNSLDQSLIHSYYLFIIE